MRYAIFFLPERDTALWAFGSAVLGYDSITGEAVTSPVPAVGVDLAALTKEPRTYGFHATLKAPFRLCESASEPALLEAADKFAAQEEILPLGSLRVRTIDQFIALMPEPDLAIQRFAARCVEAFEAFRAPMTADERAKRLRTPLTPRQIKLMDEFGYPYVFEEFRFHMTLTSSVEPALLNKLRATLADLYAPVAQPVEVASISVCAQRQGEPFRLLKRFRLGRAR